MRSACKIFRLGNLGRRLFRMVGHLPVVVTGEPRLAGGGLLVVAGMGVELVHPYMTSHRMWNM